jgi:hypothetical protein
VTVKPGNTLSEIAQDELGDATRYPELAALNNIPNPDVINVGDVIAIPAADPIPEQAAAPATLDVGQNPITVSGSAVPGGPAPVPGPAATGTTAVSQPAVGQNPTPAGVTEPETTQAPASTAQPEPPTSSRATAAPSTVSSAAPHSAADDGDHGDQSTVAPAAIGLGFSAALAGAVWLGLSAARRRKGRRRPLGQQPVAVSL